MIRARYAAFLLLCGVCLIKGTHADALPREKRVVRHQLTVASVWAVHQSRYCGNAVVRSIEAALRAFQKTRITNTTKCLPLDKATFIAKRGCGSNVKAEIIKLKGPVELNDLMWSSDRPPPKVYELIAYSIPWHPERLYFGLGHRYGSSYTFGAAKIMFMGVESPYDFLGLGSGECSMAASPSQVPATI